MQIDLDQALKIIEDEPCPWNPLQTPSWHLSQWRASLAYALKRAGAKTATQSGKVNTSKSAAKRAG